MEMVFVYSQLLISQVAESSSIGNFTLVNQLSEINNANKYKASKFPIF
jgi:hypothetical protein